ncbi:hypothetical protein ABH989_000623 [Bradyrhizobium ottawaense]
MVAASDDAEAAAGALVQMGEPAGILLFIDQRVVGLFGAEPMPPHLHRTMVVVELHVEEALAIRGPDHAAIGLLDHVVEILGRCPVAHADRKIFRALGVGAPGLQLVIIGVPAAAEPEIFVVFCKRIAVEHDLAVAAVARHAAEQLVLSTLAKPAEIGKRAVRRRHAGIVLLDPPAHLPHQRLLQAGGVAEQAVGVDVLLIQIFADVGIQHFGIAQHLLPFRVLQPGIVVGNGDPVPREGMRPARGDGGLGRGFGLGHSVLISIRVPCYIVPTPRIASTTPPGLPGC